MSAHGQVIEAKLRRTRFFLTICAFAVCALVAAPSRVSADLEQQQSTQSKSPASPNPPQQDQTAPQDSKPPLPRGKKLILKDGNVQLVREGAQVVEADPGQPGHFVLGEKLLARSNPDHFRRLLNRSMLKRD